MSVHAYVLEYILFIRSARTAMTSTICAVAVKRNGVLTLKDSTQDLSAFHQAPRNTRHMQLAAVGKLLLSPSSFQRVCEEISQMSYDWPYVDIDVQYTT